MHIHTHTHTIHLQYNTVEYFYSFGNQYREDKRNAFGNVQLSNVTGHCVSIYSNIIENSYNNWSNYLINSDCNNNWTFC